MGDNRPESFLDGRVTLWCGDVREVLAQLPADHFDCVVTSPPYWGLRDYGVTGQLGLEQSLGEHLAVMVDVFREVRRVLKPTGTLWLNYGDCYAASPNGRSAADTKTVGDDDRTFRDKPFSTVGPIHRSGKSGNKGNSGTDHGNRVVAGGKLVRWNRQSERNGHNLGGSDESVADYRVMHAGYLKPKDLCMVPNRLAIALQDDGWWVRSEIIWHKPNPMPESTRDRPTSAHEKIWLLTKSARYFYDADAIKEPMSDVSFKRLTQPNVLAQTGGPKDPLTGNRSHKKAVQNQAERLIRHGKWTTRYDGWEDYDKSLGANARNVWTFGTSAFPEAHFATFPVELAERCIKAGSPANGLVLDPFGGAGTTGLAAASLGRSCTLIELNPEYCILARARIEAAFMGKDEGSRHLVKTLGKTADAGPLFTKA